MSYASLNDLIDRYGERLLIQLTDRGEIATGAVDSDPVDRALADADAMIDGFLAARYRLPLAETPPQIADIARAIAIYKLHVNGAATKIEDEYKDARQDLRAISAGTIRLPLAGIEPEGTGGSGARVTDRERPMTAANMKGFI